MARAFQTGIRQLWPERILSQLLQNKILLDEEINSLCQVEAL